MRHSGAGLCYNIGVRLQQDRQTMQTNMETTGAKRGFAKRFINALRPSRVYIARKIILPFMPGRIESEDKAPTASNALVGSGSFTLSHCRVVTSEEIAAKRARLLANA